MMAHPCPGTADLACCSACGCCLTPDEEAAQLKKCELAVKSLYSLTGTYYNGLN
jgi:hypothetical protein